MKMVFFIFIVFSSISFSYGSVFDIDNGYYDLSLRVPITKNNDTISIKLWSDNSGCYIKIGDAGPQSALDLPPPCDVTTKGSYWGFEPWIRFDKKLDIPEVVILRVVGGLKYYGEYRAECGYVWRDVELRWSKPKYKININLGPLSSDANKDDILRCPRYYNYNKLWEEWVQ